MDLTKTPGIDIDSWYRIRILVETWTHGIDMDSWYRHGLIVWTWTHGIDMDLWYWKRLMVWTQTYGIDNTHGIDLNSWYSIGTPESHTYKRAEFYPYAGFFFLAFKKKSWGQSKTFFMGGQTIFLQSKKSFRRGSQNFFWTVQQPILT